MLTSAENATEQKNKQEEKKREKETLPESIAGFAAVLVGGLFIITFILQQFEIPSSSMENTLLIGDHLFVDRLTPTGKKGPSRLLMPYREIHRGDIAVLLSPEHPGLYLVKRIIAVPGDRLHLQDGMVVLNGVRQAQPYVIRSLSYEPARDNFPAAGPAGPSMVTEWPETLQKNMQGQDVVIPPDSYFAMGDNRDNSFDSRYWGFVPRKNIIGSPLFIFWSLNQTERDYPQDATLAERAALFIKTGAHFFALTRWSRVFRMVK